eukprot:TRINITY_DN26235_c0_g1_i1.p1 TRINITY_DN26235_c0_g1~~TRINITY_DN26235_c0_g1_i1.p1  ORF type:complete len:601 (-),score=40.80 TRINITY_DN26235_c0_g1_i1:66-1868(-)
MLSRAHAFRIGGGAIAGIYLAHVDRLPLRRQTFVIKCDDLCGHTEHWRPARHFFQEYTFQRGDEVGSGGFGRVYIAEHNTTGVSRAVKLVSVSSARADLSLQRELEIMLRLQHCPHVVQVTEAFVDDTYRYMVMEACFGLDLIDSLIEELTCDGKPSDCHPHIPHVAAVFREMVTAVAECHDKQICHMDIKPENFAHTSTESSDGATHIKILDFGLAIADVEKMSFTDGTRLGCSKYLAPELFQKGLLVALKPCDMYALGVSLCNLLTGDFPFPFAPTGRPFNLSNPKLSRIPDPAARELISKLLSADPSKRPSARDVLKHEFIQKHANAQVEPLSEFKKRSMKSLFIDPSSRSGAVVRTIKAGEVLIKEGDISHAVYYVTHGSFDVTRQGAIVARIGPDSVVGELSAVFDHPRCATVTAAVDSEVIECNDMFCKMGAARDRYLLRQLQEVASKNETYLKTEQFLRNSTLFKDAPQSFLNMVIAASDHAHFHCSEELQSEKDKHSFLYFVQEGLIELSISTSPRTVRVSPGEVVGVMECIFGPHGRGTLVAVEPTSALVLEPSAFARILSKFPAERKKVVDLAEKRLHSLGLHLALEAPA